ncbi:MAG: serine hydrolase [Cellulomonadaceae bacterium]|jgi:CubicO group peptidase (beta-lactamase class C family)|nr:serine hydrolase [Cellulomonadaceae bacterium]
MPKFKRRLMVAASITATVATVLGGASTATARTTNWDNLKRLLQQQVQPLVEDGRFCNDKGCRDGAGVPGLDGGQSAVQVVVRLNGSEVFDEAYGYARKFDAGNNRRPVERPASEWVPITDDTVWDMASVTKVLSTNLALQHLVYQGKLNINDLVSKYIPEYHDYQADLALLAPDRQFTGKSETKVVDLLHHVAGQTPDPQYHNDNYLKSAQAQSYFGYLTQGTAYDKLFVQNLDNPTSRQSIINAIAHTPLASNLGEKQAYSDVDYILLGLIIEKITGMPLDQYVENELYKPLGLTHTMYNPLSKGMSRSDFAATEVNGNSRDGARRSDGRNANEFSFANMRTRTLQGEVHDEKAYYVMAGVSGHAGLFTTAHEAGILMQLMLNDGEYNGVRLFDKATVDLFTTPAKFVTDTGYRADCYGLGWWTNDLDNQFGGTCYGSYFSNLASPEVYGHQGWAGPLVFADPAENLVVVYMRNRSHNPVVSPDNPNSFVGGGTTADTYGQVSNAVYRAIGMRDSDKPSTLPDFGTPVGTISHNFSQEMALQVKVNFVDPLNGVNARRIGPRNPMVLRVAHGAAENSVRRTDIRPMQESDWTRDSGSYYFTPWEPGDYYVRINDATGAKSVLWATVTNSANH